MAAHQAHNKVNTKTVAPNDSVPSTEVVCTDKKMFEDMAKITEIEPGRLQKFLDPATLACSFCKEIFSDIDQFQAHATECKQVAQAKH